MNKYLEYKLSYLGLKNKISNKDYIFSYHNSSNENRVNFLIEFCNFQKSSTLVSI